MGDGNGVADVDGVGVAVGIGVGDGAGVGVSDGAGDGVAVGVGVGVAVGVAVGIAVGVGSGSARSSLNRSINEKDQVSPADRLVRSHCSWLPASSTIATTVPGNDPAAV